MTNFLFLFSRLFQVMGTSTLSVVALLESRTLVYVWILDFLLEVDDQHHKVCKSQVCQRSLWHVIE